MSPKVFIRDQSTEMMNAMSVISLLPSTEDEMIIFVNKIRREVTRSSDPAGDFKKLTYALKTLNAIMQDEEINNFYFELGY